VESFNPLNLWFKIDSELLIYSAKAIH